MENAKRGSIKQYFNDHPEIFVFPYKSFSIKGGIIDDVNSALVFMHKKFIIHRDIKTDNIVL